MMRLKRNQEHTVDTLFILALFVLFAATSLSVILIGAREYQTIVTRMGKNSEVRSCCSYLEEKLHQNDSSNAIGILTMEDHTVLALTNTVNDVNYTTYIYTYEDSLREFYAASDSSFSLSSGQPIADAADFSVEFVSTARLRLTITDLDGHSETFYFSPSADTVSSSL